MAQTKVKSELIDGGLGTDWQSAIKTSNFTAEAGKGYFVDTTSNEITVSLPAGVVGEEIIFQDYAGTFDTNKIIFDSNSNEKIQGATDNYKCIIENARINLVYQNATKGWTADNLTDDPPVVTTDYLVVAGGATGGTTGGRGGGGGAGGYRTSYADGSVAALILDPATNYAVTVGAGGAAPGTNQMGNVGSTSTFATISSSGGGRGSGNNPNNYQPGGPGGSGGGGSYIQSSGGGAGNAGGYTPVEGYAGGTGSASGYGAGAGGGAGAVGGNGASNDGGTGGIGKSNLILSTTNAATASVGQVSGSDVYYASGGGGGYTSSAGANSLGGGKGTVGTNATANTGGGASGGGNQTLGVGGSGVVIIRYPSNYTATIPGGLTQSSGSPFTEGSYKISVFTAGTGNIQFN